MNFRILGPIEVLGDDGGSLQLGKRMERALLAMLLMNARKVCTADQLIEGLWPSNPPARADASLHSLIARLRRSLQPDRSAGESSARLVRHSPGYQLVVADDEIDACRFERYADAGYRLLAAGDPEGAHQQFHLALAEWRGPALAEFAFDPFADREAARLEERRLGVTEADLGSRLALCGPNLVPELEQHVIAYPLREHFWAYLLIALYRAGRQADALRRANELRQKLHDVGLDPSPWIGRIETAILNHDPLLHDRGLVLDRDLPTPGELRLASDDGRIAVTNLSLPRWWRPDDRFIGREHEIELIETARRRSADGDVHLVALVGEPGIGKSSLAFEAGQRAIDDGAIVLAGRCSPESAVPFEPFVEAFGRVIDAMSDLDVTLLGDHARWLGRLLPGHAARLDAPPGFDGRGDDVDRYLLFESVVELCDLLTQQAPVVLVVDDLHWADEASFALLDHLLRSDRLDSVFIVATLRDADLADRTSLLRDFDEWLRLGVAGRVELVGLSSSELESLFDRVHQQVGEPPLRRDVERFARNLHAATGGNPFFAVEIVRQFDTGLVPEGETIVLPDSVQALVRTRFGRMGDARRSVLETAALIGPRIDTDLLVGVVGDGALVLAALDDACAAGLLTERSGVLAFRHDLVRTALESSTGPALRAARHRSIGQALLERHAPDLAPIADLLAHHFARAAADGDAVDAARFSLLAGNAAVASFAYDPAVSRYETGLRAAEGARPIPGTLEVDLRLSLAEAWRRLGELERTVQVVDASIDLIFERATLPQLRRTAWAFAYGEPGPDLVDVERKLKHLEHLIGSHPDSTDEDLAIVGLALAAVSNDLGHSTAAIEIMAEALGRYSSSWSSETLVCAVDVALTVMGERRPIADRVRIVDALLTLLNERDDFAVEERLQTYSAARWLRLAAGRIEEAMQFDVVLEHDAERLRMPRYLAGVAQRRASLELIRGRFAEAETLATEALNHRPDPEFFEGYVAQLAMIRLHQGRTSELLVSMEAMDENDHPAWLVGRALMWSESGDERQAQQLLGRFLDELATHERDVSWLGTLALASYTVDNLHLPDVAQRIREELLPHRGQVALGGRGAVIFAPVELLLGELAGVCGDLDGVERHLRAADPVITALGAEALRVRRELVHAEALAGAGGVHRDDSRAHARTAASIMEHLRIGGRLAGRVSALLGSWN